MQEIHIQTNSSLDSNFHLSFSLSSLFLSLLSLSLSSFLSLITIYRQVEVEIPTFTSDLSESQLFKKTHSQPTHTEIQHNTISDTHLVKRESAKATVRVRERTHAHERERGREREGGSEPDSEKQKEREKKENTHTTDTHAFTRHTIKKYTHLVRIRKKPKQ